MSRPYETNYGRPSRGLRKLLESETQTRCAHCGMPQSKLNRKLHIHRVISNGKYNPENCVLLCPKCHNNAGKKTRKELTWFSSKVLPYLIADGLI